jgi:hypothetical protein
MFRFTTSFDITCTTYKWIREITLFVDTYLVSWIGVYALDNVMNHKYKKLVIIKLTYNMALFKICI